MVCLLEVRLKQVLISFREWLHSYMFLNSQQRKWYPSSSHLFQRVASFLQVIKLIHGVFDRLGFSSLSESGFIPTREFMQHGRWVMERGSHLFQRVASFLHVYTTKLNMDTAIMFSSLSESGFIPTYKGILQQQYEYLAVLISFREWLHSYKPWISVL